YTTLFRSQERLDEVKQKDTTYTLQGPEKEWAKLRFAADKDFESSPDTAITKAVLEKLVKAILHIPEGFTPISKLVKLLAEKEHLFTKENQIDWATAELLAYASILNEGKDVRMSGQDVLRGTFSHRHAVLHDMKTYECYNRLSAIDKNQGQIHIYNSLLNEYGVLGFEYGYSLANPHTLTIREAQLGDFANGAQTIIDHYISSAEAK